MSSIDSDYAAIDVEYNEDSRDATPEQTNDLNNGFLYYRYYLDIEPNESSSPEQYISSIRMLLEGLRSRGLRVVAACEYEDQL